KPERTGRASDAGDHAGVRTVLAHRAEWWLHLAAASVPVPAGSTADHDPKPESWLDLWQSVRRSSPARHGAELRRSGFPCGRRRTGLPRSAGSRRIRNSGLRRGRAMKLLSLLIITLFALAVATPVLADGWYMLIPPAGSTNFFGDVPLNLWNVADSYD